MLLKSMETLPLTLPGVGLDHCIILLNCIRWKLLLMFLSSFCCLQRVGDFNLLLPMDVNIYFNDFFVFSFLGRIYVGIIHVILWEWQTLGPYALLSAAVQ